LADEARSVVDEWPKAHTIDDATRMIPPRLSAMTEKGAPLKVLAWLGVAGLGAIGGLLLGQMATGGMNGGNDDGASYAELTGNPDALRVETQPVVPCDGCGEGYGSGMRAKFAREDRMDGEFRELGAVAIDYTDEPADDYRYGGSFDDPGIADTVIAMQSPVPTAQAQPPSPPASQPESGAPPIVVATTPSAEMPPVGTAPPQ